MTVVNDSKKYFYNNLVTGARSVYHLIWGFSGGSAGKESACNVEDLGLIPGLGRSPGGGHGNPLQYSGLENPHGQESVGYSLWGCRVGHDWLSSAHTALRTRLSDWAQHTQHLVCTCCQKCFLLNFKLRIFFTQSPACRFLSLSSSIHLSSLLSRTPWPFSFIFSLLHSLKEFPTITPSLWVI